MAVRRSALEEVGLLDEGIFVYMDDVDLCARVTAAGWHVWYAAETTAVHFMGASLDRGSPAGRRRRRCGRSTGGTSAATVPRPGRALRAVEVLGFGGRVLLHSVGAVRRAARRPGPPGRPRPPPTPRPGADRCLSTTTSTGHSP